MAQYDNMIGSNGFVAPPVPYDKSEGYAGLGQAMAGLALSAMPNPQADQNRASARKLNAEAQQKENEIAQYAKMAEIMGQMTDPEAIASDPKTASMNMRRIGMQILKSGASAGIPAKNMAELIMASGAVSGLPNDVLVSFRAGAGMTTGKDEALTQERQDQIRKENFAQETNLNAMDNATSRANNAASIAGQDRRERETKVGFNDMANVDAEIDAQLGISDDGGPTVDPNIRTAIRAAATDNYKAGANPASAVARAIKDNADYTPGKVVDWGFDIEPSVKPKASRKVFNPATGRLE